MREASLLAPLSALLLLAGPACGSSDDDGGDSIDAGETIDGAPTIDAEPPVTHTLTFTGNGYRQNSTHRGDVLHFALWDDGNSAAPVATHAEGPLAQGGPQAGITVVFEEAIAEGRSYKLYWYADDEGDTVCDAGANHWSHEIPTITGDFTAVRNHDTSFDGDCTKH